MLYGNDITLAIWMVTYNQENYIVEAIEGVLRQRTSFKFKLFIGDDCSTDNTKKICTKYSQKYPDIIQVISTQVNNMQQNSKNIYEACFSSNSKYIAMCEGDDYWTDSFKLQKQVDFLEENTDYAICYSAYEIFNEFNHTKSVRTPFPQHIDIETMIRQNNYSTATVVFASEYLKPIPSWFNNIIFGDWCIYLAIMYLSKKKAYCLNDVTAVYRIHSGGTHGNLHGSNQKLIKAYKQHIDFYRLLQENLFKADYEDLINECISVRKQIIADLLRKENRRVAAFFSKFY